MKEQFPFIYSCMHFCRHSCPLKFLTVSIFYAVVFHCHHTFMVVFKSRVQIHKQQRKKCISNMPREKYFAQKHKKQTNKKVERRRMKHNCAHT